MTFVCENCYCEVLLVMELVITKESTKMFVVCNDCTTRLAINITNLEAKNLGALVIPKKKKNGGAN